MVRLWERVWNFVKEGLVLLGGVRGSASCGLGGDGGGGRARRGGMRWTSGNKTSMKYLTIWG